MAERTYYAPKQPNGPVQRAELHFHTTGSDGNLSPEAVVRQAYKRGLNVLAITDHNMIGSSYLAANYNVNFSGRKNDELQVLLGSEITALDNGKRAHIIGIDIKDDIRPYQTPRQIISQIHEQGGLAIIPHPAMRYVSSLSFDSLRDLLRDPNIEVRPDAVEVFNASGEATHTLHLAPMFGRDPNGQVRQFCEKNSEIIPAVTGGTDGHWRRVGLGATIFWGGDIRTAITQGTTAVVYDSTIKRPDVAIQELSAIAIGAVRMYRKRRKV